jgi:Fe-S oxidoreductase
VRESDRKAIIAAAGTSCRQQIKDGTRKKALHPIKVLAAALDNARDQVKGNEL